MRKTLLGLAVVAAIATPLAFATTANASTVQTTTTTKSTAADCVPVTEVVGYTETLYKYTPAGKTSDGPTQWDEVDAPAGTHKTWTVKGKPVDYVRDGDKTSVTEHPGINGVDCADAAGDVTWVVHGVPGYGDFTGTVKFSADNVDGGTLDMTNSLDYWLKGTVTPGTVVKNGNTVTFSGTFTEGDVKYNGGTGYFNAIVIDGGTTGPDQIAVFVNEGFTPGILAEVTGGNLTVF